MARSGDSVRRSWKEGEKKKRMETDPGEWQEGETGVYHCCHSAGVYCSTAVYRGGHAKRTHGEVSTHTCMHRPPPTHTHIHTHRAVFVVTLSVVLKPAPMQSGLLQCSSFAECPPCQRGRTRRRRVMGVYI